MFEVRTKFHEADSENVWTNEDGSPQVFETREEAEEELSDHIEDYNDSVDEGDIEGEKISEDDFEIVEI